MVNNFDRMLAEITHQAHHAAGEFDAEMLVALAMEIVDREDQHAIKPTNINQSVEGLIEQAVAGRGHT